jgi:hypothetical protein
MGLLIQTILTTILRLADRLLLCFALYMEGAEHIDPPAFLLCYARKSLVIRQNSQILRRPEDDSRGVVLQQTYDDNFL